MGGHGGFVEDVVHRCDVGLRTSDQHGGLTVLLGPEPDLAFRRGSDLAHLGGGRVEPDTDPLEFLRDLLR